jgi:putative DNA primase/helicase
MTPPASADAVLKLVTAQDDRVLDRLPGLMQDVARLSLPEAARAYAAARVPIFPCKPAGKEPAAYNGFYDATTDLAMIARWWRQNPEYNIGCPPASCGLTVVDCDSYKPDYVEPGDLPPTFVTGCRGDHHWFAGTTHGGKWPGCVDIKSEGGYVLLPPSLFAAGSYVVRRVRAIAPLPAWVLERPVHETQEAPAGLVEDDDVPALLVEARLRIARYTAKFGIGTEPRGNRAFALVGLLRGMRSGGKILSPDKVVELMQEAGYGEVDREMVASGKYANERGWEDIGLIALGPPWKISAGAPYDTAKLFLEVMFTADARPTLHRHRGDFYLWNGAAYPEVTEPEVRARAYSFLDQCALLVPNKETRQWETSPVKPNPRNVNDLLDALRAAALLPGTISAPVWLEQVFDLDPRDIVACANGLLHLPTLDLLPHTPAFFSHNALDYSFEPNVPAPGAWLGFLAQLWPDDAQSIEALQEIFGYMLVADTSQQKAFLLVGPKRSGKGTIGRVLARLVGAENAVAPTLAGLGTNFGLQPLIGKRVAIISDARLGGRADQSAIAERLLSITGEDAITVDRKYREPWTGRLETRFLVLTNELPRLNDASGALASRFIVLVLTESFYGREDHGLSDRLIAELPGILNWAIRGWCRLQERGYFVQPASAEDMIADLEDLGSPIGAFLRDCCEVKQGKSVLVDSLFGVWQGWCLEQNREKYIGTKQSFGRDLRAAVPGLRMTQVRTKDGCEDRRHRLYEGIGLAGPPVTAAGLGF